MRVAEHFQGGHSSLEIKNYDARIMLGYACFSVAFLVLIYAASAAAGLVPGDLAAMSVFP